MSAPPTDLASPVLVQPMLPLGERLGSYEITGLLGQGSMGEVHAARDTVLGRRVAIKVVRGGASPEGLLAEAQAMAQLAHPNVITVHEAGTIGGRVYLVMELVEGQTVRGWLEAAPRGWREIIDVFVAAGRGLAAAHGAGIVHRDFKPDNLLVGRDGRVRVGDFGLASATGAGDLPDDLAAMATVDGGAASASGTPAYMAPEQHIGKAVDPRTDQFGFCVALYEALYGHRPFEGMTTAEVRRRVLAGPAPAPARKRGVPARFGPIIARGLSTDPAARWPSMDALLAALTRDPMRNLARWGVAGIVVAALAVGAWGLLRRPEVKVKAGGCSGQVARTRMATAWDPEIAAGVRARWTGDDESWKRIAGLLDDYRLRWIATRRTVCMDTTITPEKNTEQMLCLQHQLEALRAVTSTLGPRSERAVTALDPPEGCRRDPVR